MYQSMNPLGGEGGVGKCLFVCMFWIRNHIGRARSGLSSLVHKNAAPQGGDIND